MPKRPSRGGRQTGEDHARHSPSPTATGRQRDTTLLGGLREVPIKVREHGQAVTPWMALWVDGTTGMVIASRLIDASASHDGGHAAALDALLSALDNDEAAANAAPPPQEPTVPLRRTGNVIPFPGPRRRPHDVPIYKSGANPPTPTPSMPSLVLIEDAALAQTVRDFLAPLGITVEYRKPLPLLDMAFDALNEFAREELAAPPVAPFHWDADPAAVAAIYHAAARYWRRSPWSYCPPDTPIYISLGDAGPEDDVPALFATVMGQHDLARGLACYYSAQGLLNVLAQGDALAPSDEDIDSIIEMLRRVGAPVEDIPPHQVRDAIATIAAEHNLLPPPAVNAGGDCLVMLFESRDETEPSYLAWLDAHGYELANQRYVPIFMRVSVDDVGRPLTTQETWAFALAIEALCQFCSHYRARFRKMEEQELTTTVSESAQLAADFPTAARPYAQTAHIDLAEAGPARDVMVRFPPPAEVWPEPDDNTRRDTGAADSRGPTSTRSARVAGRADQPELPTDFAFNNQLPPAPPNNHRKSPRPGHGKAPRGRPTPSP